MRISDWSSDVCSSDLSWNWSHQNRSWQHERAHHYAGVYPAHHPQAQRASEDRPASRHGARHRWRDRPARAEGDRQGVELATEAGKRGGGDDPGYRSEEHTSELQSLMRISYAVFCLKKK